MKKEVWAQIMDTFSEDMYNQGFTTRFIDNQPMPRMVASKNNHYRFEMIAFIEPDSISISLSARIGLDIKSVMYFIMNDLERDTWARYQKMMEAAKPYINTDLQEIKEDRRYF